MNKTIGFWSFLTCSFIGFALELSRLYASVGLIVLSVVFTFNLFEFHSLIYKDFKFINLGVTVTGILVVVGFNSLNGSNNINTIFSFSLLLCCVSLFRLKRQN